MLPSSNDACSPSTSAGPQIVKAGTACNTANDAAARYIHPGARRDFGSPTLEREVFGGLDVISKAGLFKKPLASASASYRRSPPESTRSKLMKIELRHPIIADQPAGQHDCHDHQFDRPPASAACEGL